MARDDSNPVGKEGAPRSGPNRPAALGGENRAEALVALVRLQWFIRLRWFMTAVAAGALFLERLALPGASRPVGLYLVIGGLALVNLAWAVISRSRANRALVRRSERRGYTLGEAAFANAQIAIDLLALTAILRYSGGIENPMAVFYLFHMAIAAMLLPRRHAMLQGAWACLLFGALAYGELAALVTPHYPFLMGAAPTALHKAPGFVLASMTIVACGIAGVLYFTLQIVRRLDDQERSLRDVNRALRESEAALQALQRRKAQFMRTAAHQLKAPLATIQTQVGLLRDGVVPPEKLRTVYTKIIQRCRQAIEQVSDLLTFARLHEESECDGRGPACADLGRELRRLCKEQFGPSAAEKGLQLRCRIPDGTDLRIRVDPIDLSDALSNLIDNAIRYTPAPGSVDVSAARTDRDVSATVRDTGPGFEGGVASPLFEPYRRGQRALEAGICGSGLGLSIVRAVMERAAGTIRVASCPGQGSEFTLIFPAATSQNGPTSVAPTGLRISTLGAE